MISDDTYFLEPSPEYTVTSPGDAADAMTVYGISVPGQQPVCAGKPRI